MASSRYTPGNHLHSRANLYAPTSSSPYEASPTQARTPSPSYRAVTPNSRGQYSASTLDELESQNDEQVEGLSAKVKMLRDITEAIGDEVRASNKMIDGLADSFESTRNKLRGTMGSMLRMAKRTGVGWKAWVAFFAAVILLFWWVWL